MPAACGDTESRSTDDGARQIKERFSEIEQTARTGLAETPVKESGPSIASGFPEVMGYEIDGKTVTWHLYFKRTGRDNQSFSNSSTLQVASCIDLRGSKSGVEAYTVRCPTGELADRREHFDVEVDVLDD